MGGCAVGVGEVVVSQMRSITALTAGTCVSWSSSHWGRVLHTNTAASACRICDAIASDDMSAG